MSTTEIDKKAPQFTLEGTMGTWSLKDATGSALVVYFYPRDNTSGCTQEGLEFAALHDQFKKARSLILGISPDSVASHEKFKKKMSFPFDLLSDPEQKVCRLYDVIRQKSMYGRKYLGVELRTFLIDAKGVLRQEWRKVKVRSCRGGIGGGESPVTGNVRPLAAAVLKSRQGKAKRRLFVLDTNVLMHDPTAIFRFEEHDVYIPMTVLEELDAGKKGLSESARNVRQVSRFLDELMQGASKKQIDRGLPLPAAIPINHGKRPPGGRLFFQTQLLESVLPDSLPGHGADNAILANTLALQQKFRGARVTLVSKDINLRIKAAILGVHAEDYSSDKTIEDADLLVSGVQQLPQNFWDRHGKGMESWQQQSRTYYRVRGPLVREWQTNQFVYDPGENGVEAIVRKLEGESAILELTVDYRNERNSVWGVTSRNREQNLALNLLMDPEIDFVTVLGPAGTGKTLLTLAAGLAQTLDHNRFSEIIMTRVTIPLGEDIGFLPGTEEEKMEPWMGALMDNLEVLTQSQGGGTWGRGATNDLLRHRIKIRSLNFMRGRTFLNRFIILDEAQNLTPKQMKALVTRAGPGTKMVCLGNIAQIDTPYLTETTSGLTYVVNRFHGWTFSGHITLVRGERSRLADYASEVL